MKKLSFFYITLTTLLYISPFLLNGQGFDNKQPVKRNWTTDNPFHTDVFVENYGQFDNWAKVAYPIKYVVNSSDKIFFTETGVVFRIQKFNKLSETEKEEQEKVNKTKKSEIFFVSMQWDGCNANSILQVSEEAEGYYTFGEKGYENINSKGYKKLLYKDLYPGIDAEYTIPEKGGLKYKLILHPGADLSLVKMSYTGDVEKIKIDKDGNIIIKTPAGNITDHAPLSFYKEDNSKIFSTFSLNGNIISFRLQPTINNQKTIEIDPWTVTPNTLTTDKAAYDIDVDDNGNVYISGGTYPLKLAKYSSTGSIKWTYTNPANWGDFGSSWSYSKFCILPQSGTIFIGEGCFYSSGPRIMKISTNGNLIYTTPNLYGNEEIWVMFYNRCKEKLIAFGGGTMNPNNIQLLSDTNLTSSTVINYTNNWNTHNDIAAVEMDYNGDFFSLLTSTKLSNAQLLKSLASSNYSSPPAFNVNPNYYFNEFWNKGIPGFSSSYMYTVRANALALNSSYLFGYDGNTIKAWSKANGNLLGSVVVNAVYAGGQYRTHEGIDVDECNNVYVGGKNTVHVYSFNGSSFTLLSPITANISNEVYDIKLDRFSGKLFISGLSFVTESDQAISCPIGQIPMTVTVDSCLGNACAVATGGIPPFHYQWSNGDTSSCITGVPSGVYIVTVVDNSCMLLKHVDTVTINQSLQLILSNDTAICPGNSVTLTVGGASTYSWTPVTGLNTTTGTVVVANPAVTTTYYVNGVSNGCTAKDSVTIIVNSGQSVHVSPNPATICTGDSVSLTASGAYSYTWFPATGLNSSTGTIVIANPVTTTNYLITGYLNGCSDSAIVTVNVNTNPIINISPNPVSICSGNSVSLTASGASTYLWAPASGLNTTTGATVTANPVMACTYTVTGALNGCSNTDSVNVTVNSIPNLFISPNPVTICSGNSISLTASGASTYSWSPSTGLNSTTDATVIANPATTTAYTVTGTLNGCSNVSSVVVTVKPTPNISISPNPSTICSGNSVTLSATGASSYTWSPASGLNTTVGASVFASPTTTTTYTVTGTFSGCSNAGNVIVNVNPVPTISILPNPVTICSGDSVSLTASGASSCLWSPATGLNSTIGTSVFANPTTTTTYTVTGTLNGCSNVSNVIVNVNPAPAITISPNPVTICSGDSVSLTASGASTYSWSPALGLNTTNGATVIANSTLTTTFTVTGTLNGCPNINNITVTVNPIPNITISPNPVSICSGNSVSLTASGASTYSWSPATGLNSTSDATVLANPATTTIYTVTGTLNGCSNDGSVNVTVNPVPAISISPNPVTICSGDSVSLTASGASTYLWSPATGLNSTTGMAVTANPTATTTYSVSGTLNGCTNINNVIVTVNPIPDISISPSPATICSGDYITLIASGGALTYLWAPASGLNSTTSATVIANPFANTTYIVSGSLNGCSNIDSVIVTVNPTPNIFISPNPANVCLGDSVLLSASGASNYLWSPTQGLNVTTGAVVIATPINTTTYYISGNLNGCSDTSSIVVTVMPVSSVDLGNDTTICPDSSIVLNAENTGSSFLWSTGAISQQIVVSNDGTYWVNVTTGNCTSSDTINVSKVKMFDLGRDFSLCNDPEIILHADINAASYLWSTGQTSPTISVNDTGTYWLIINYQNCLMTDTVQVKGGYANLYFPNAFTPDKDNLNEVFVPLGEGILKYNLKIFNRWGELIFQSPDLNTGWDGTYKNNKAQIGIYVWVVDYQTICTGERNLRKYGSVMLLR